MNPPRPAQQLIDWHVATQPLAGEEVSGDLHLVQAFEGGVLIAVVDGVGHGESATAAAQAAVAILRARPQESVIWLMKRCHEALTQTRGVVMTLVSLNAIDHTIAWLGVGNVEGRLLRTEPDASHPSECTLLRGGLVGLHLPALHASVLPVAPGDLLVLATDGIRAGFDRSVDIRKTPESIADTVLQQHFKGTDDGLVLVARYRRADHGRC